MYINNLIKGNLTGNFMPKNNLTRAELLTIIDNIYESISSDIIKDKYYISGTVIDDKGSPAKGAILYINSGEIYRNIETDDKGQFSFYTESNHSYHMEVSYFDNDDYGYKALLNLPILTSDQKDLEIKLEKTPVVVYNAVDKNGLDIPYVRVYKTIENGKTYTFIKQITIDEGQYKSYDCTFIFDDF